MALYNKDGTVYKLEGPNPLMKSQELWEEFSTHNMNWNAEIHADSGSKLLIRPIEKPPTQSEEFLDDLQSTKQDYEEEEPVEQPVEMGSKKNDKSHFESSTVSDNHDIKKTFIHCLPAFKVEKRDSLYGDVSFRTHYGNKTSFEAVILNQSDMKMEMWSEVSFEEGSILYPKNGDKRWWKIQNSYPKLGGHVIQALPSQDHPYFD